MFPRKKFHEKFFFSRFLNRGLKKKMSTFSLAVHVTLQMCIRVLKVDIAMPVAFCRLEIK